MANTKEIKDRIKSVRDTQKITNAMYLIASTKMRKAKSELDLTRPIWLDLNIRDFKRHSKTRFTQDSFIEHIDFDYLEIQVIEED